MICGVLVVLLFIFLRFSIRSRRRFGTFPTFSLAINSVSREDSYIVYQADGKSVEVYAFEGRGKTLFRTCYFIQLPKDMTDEEVSRVAPNLAFGLSQLGYDYQIYQNGVRLTEAALLLAKSN